jgi:hypothetical protein
MNPAVGARRKRLWEISSNQNAWLRQNVGSVSPSPRFAESAEQNGERAGVRCFVLLFNRCYDNYDADKPVFLQNL